MPQISCHSERGAGESKNPLEVTFKVSPRNVSTVLDMTSDLASFHLPILQFDGRSATKDGDGNPQLAPFRVNFFNNTVLVLEGSISNLDGFADFK